MSVALQPTDASVHDAPHYDPDTPAALVAAYERARRGALPVRVWYGNTTTGEAHWDERQDTIGGVIVCGPAPERLPCLLEPECLVAVPFPESAVVKVQVPGGETLYEHPTFFLPTIMLRDVSDGRTEVWFNAVRWVWFDSREAAERYRDCRLGLRLDW